MNSRILVAPVFITLACATLWLAVPHAPAVSADPLAQSTIAPTEEPTKVPYVFSTPIFIPTYPDDTPAPRATPIATRAPGQPTSGGQTYTIQPGDSPWTIAQKVYGDGTKYPLIMSANNLTSTTRLRVGAVLIIPPLSGSVPSPAPTVAPPAPTVAPPTLQPTIAPTLAAPAPQPTPKPMSSVLGMTQDTATLAINILSVLLVVAAMFCAIMAYLKYARLQKISQLFSGKLPLRIKK